MNKQDRQHIRNMKKIMAAIQPFIDEDKSMDYKCADPHSARIREAYQSAKSEIQYTEEEYQ